jgi:hypothetical protein
MRQALGRTTLHALGFPQRHSSAVQRFSCASTR